MNGKQMLDALKQTYKNGDSALLEQYVEYIQSAKGSDVVERHHILPICDFYEYRNAKWNIVELSILEHVEAHRLLMLGAKTQSTGYAYHLMVTTRDGAEYCESARKLARELNSGENNPSKREDVKQKISLSKKGVQRLDMKGKKYMGADAETAKAIVQKSKEYMTGRVVVKDKDGNIFMTEKNDPRYTSGELVHHLDGKGFSTNNPMQSEEGKNKFKASLERKKEEIKNWTEEQLFDFYRKAHVDGKAIFTNSGALTSNYVRPLNLKGLDVSVYTVKIKEILKGSTTRQSQDIVQPSVGA
ncbi:hypothetical protein SHAb15599_00065 [Acinetobacter phage SH-Ab 15599]|nr:hypothetical protein SHAb15599_00065 [Acinetobacter phage SH-Ab 15599]